VVSHILLSRRPVEAPARTNTGNADVILGFDLIGVANADLLKTASPDKTTAVLNTNVTPTIDTIRSRTPIAGPERMLEAVQLVTRRGRNIVVDGTRLAEGLFGSHMAVNLFLLGVAWQGGLIPLTLTAIEQAVRLNGVDIDRNLQVFTWGRKYYHDAASVEQLLKPRQQRLVEFDRASELTAYQDVAYAKQYVEFVENVERRAPALADVVAKNLYKLMAYKDEYEVARLLTKPEFESQALEIWAAPESISYNLHPPLLRSFGVHKKLKLGSWFRTPLLVLKRFKGLRGTALDIFGYAAHRRLERSMIQWYRELMEQVIENLTPDNLPLALEIAALPDQIRGYEKIKEQNIAKVKLAAAEKLETLKASLHAGVNAVR
jgi:indolepyruvate ferredoxin oxidoreductase